MNDRNLNEYFVWSKRTVDDESATTMTTKSLVFRSERGFSSTVVKKEKWRRMMVVKKKGGDGSDGL